jgi:hypothetical protein
MGKLVTIIRFWAASIAAGVAMFAPWALIFFSNGPSAADDNWQRGLALFPIIFLFGAFFCSSVATWLQTNGCLSFGRFTVGSSRCGDLVACCRPCALQVTQHGRAERRRAH